jgi:hypothetical protein
MVTIRFGITGLLLTGLLISSSFGIAGIGFHWGKDLTLQMEDKEQEWLSFEDLIIDDNGITGTLPPEITSITGTDLPIFLSRTDWESTSLNLGGKIFIDVIPFLNCIELSANYGLWQYNGSIAYPTSMSIRDNVSYSSVSNPEDLFDVVYDTVPLTLKEISGVDVGGLTGTPYMKLQFDLTVRKYLLKLPPVVNILKIYGGGGLSLHFATPILHKTIIEDALGSTLDDSFSLDALNDDLFSNDELMKNILQEIVDRMMTPHMGMHFDLGASVKVPIIPLGAYIDGKFMIPFGQMDENVDIGGFGLLLNFGLSLSI